MFTTFILFICRFSIILSHHSNWSYVRDKNVGGGFKLNCSRTQHAVYLYAICWCAILSLLCNNMECWLYVSLYLQLATILIFGWWKEGTILRVELRCASKDSGGQCVMMTGIPEMQWLSADSLVSPQNVSGLFWVEATV